MKNLRGQLLISVPELQDSIFERALVLVCDHEEERGAMGFIVNCPTELTLRDLIEDMDIKPEVSRGLTRPVFLGGPVSSNQGFGLYRGDYAESGCISLEGGLHLTTSRTLLEKCATGEGPEDLLMVMGYAGWSPGQLEREMSEGTWWVAKSSETLLFELPPVKRWGAALEQLGMNAAAMYPGAGHA